MKLYILGPTASGKTRLANMLSQKYNVEHISLDYIFFRHVKDKNRIELSESEWKKEISTISKRKGWIIEGVNPIGEILDQADEIVYLRPKFFTALFNQWKRYFSDPKQRKEHGFINNLKLTKYLVKQYFQNSDEAQMNNPKYSRVKKTDLLLKKYMGKTIRLESQKAVNSFILLEQF